MQLYFNAAKLVLPLLIAASELCSNAVEVELICERFVNVQNRFNLSADIEFRRYVLSRRSAEKERSAVAVVAGITCSICSHFRTSENSFSALSVAQGLRDGTLCIRTVNYACYVQ